MSGVVQIPLSRGLFATVDEADYDLLSRWKWSALKLGGPKRGERVTRFYACRVEVVDGKQRMVLMHRQLMGAVGRDQKVDHRDRDTLNNRKQNLRLCCGAQNDLNRIGWSGEKTSTYKGVCRETGKTKWRANFRGKYLGLFLTQEEAAIAYDKEVLQTVSIQERPFVALNIMDGGCHQ